ncbi:MAG: hypothetical protein ACLS3M_08695 [Collinsella sp.]
MGRYPLDASQIVPTAEAAEARRGAAWREGDYAKEIVEDIKEPARSATFENSEYDAVRTQAQNAARIAEIRPSSPTLRSLPARAT